MVRREDPPNTNPEKVTSRRKCLHEIPAGKKRASAKRLFYCREFGPHKFVARCREKTEGDGTPC